MAFAAVILMVTNNMPQGWSGWYRLSQSSKPMQAKVVACYSHGKGMASRFEYEVGGKTYMASGMGCWQGPGNFISIVYSPADPSIAASQFDQDKMKWFPLLLIAMTGVSSGAAFWIARRKAAAMNS